MRTPKLAALELKRFSRGTLPRLGIVTLMLLPLLYGALYLYSFWDPYARLDKIPVALVNNDKGTTVDGKKLTAGDDLVKGIHDSKTFKWEEVDSAEADKGVRKGKYYLSLTVPANFSEKVASSSGDDPQTGSLQVRTNDSNNYIVGSISKTVFSEIRSSASAKTSRTFLDKIFVSFSDIHKATKTAADGAGELENGLDSAKKGTHELAGGLGTAKDGSGALAGGLGELDKGAGDLSKGAGTLHEKTGELSNGLDSAKKGAGELSKGLDTAKKGAGELSKGAGDLNKGVGDADAAAKAISKGAGQVAAGTQQLAAKVDGMANNLRPLLKKHGKDIADTARAIAAGSKTIADDLDKLPKETAKAAAEARSSADQLAAIHKERCSDSESPDPACSALKKASDAAALVARTAERVDTVVKSHSKDIAALTGKLRDLSKTSANLAERAPHLESDLDSAVKNIDTLNAGAKKVSEGAGALADGTGKLKDGSGRLAAGAGGLVGGAGQLSDGAHSLVDGAGKLADGAGKLRDGAGTLADGAGKVHDGAGSARAGADQLDDGLGKLKEGAITLDGGLYKLKDGSNQLASGLAGGVDKIPDLDKKARDARTEAMADPVKLASQSMHKAPNYGTGLAPYFIPLALWVGAMVVYMLVKPLSPRALAAGAPAWRTALSGWLPAFAIGVVQVGALLAVLHWVLGLEMARTAGTIGYLLLAASCFTAVIQWVNAQFGGAVGKVLTLVLLMIQLTSAGGTYPVESSPGFFGALHPFLPFSWVTDGLRRLITGGDMTVVWQGTAVLAAFTVVSLTLTAWSTRRNQVWSLKKLHPELAL